MIHLCLGKLSLSNPSPQALWEHGYSSKQGWNLAVVLPWKCMLSLLPLVALVYEQKMKQQFVTKKERG